MQIRPYLIFPKIIPQPTWGGDYIGKMKGWELKNGISGVKVGQSYELFGGSKLSLHLTDTTDPDFRPDLGTANGKDEPGLGSLVDGVDFLSLANLVQFDPVKILGEEINNKYGLMPLLIKLNQASGNSFQLHLPPTKTHTRWKPKAESWYYLEDGRLTFGVKKGIDLADYKRVCEEINTFMQELSLKVLSQEITLDDARTKTSEQVKNLNPWSFVNVHDAEKYSIIDLSRGGIHHSWEENTNPNSPGNVIYEVQQDVMDPECTIRSFDQGKIKDDGTIREIHIDDYFDAIDTDPDHNDITNATFTQKGEELLRTEIYKVDLVEVVGFVTQTTNSSFQHLFVRDGRVEIVTGDTTLTVSAGHSAFVPQAVNEFELRSIGETAHVIKTFL